MVHLCIPLNVKKTEPHKQAIKKTLFKNINMDSEY